MSRTEQGMLWTWIQHHKPSPCPSGWPQQSIALASYWDDDSHICLPGLNLLLLSRRSPKYCLWPKCSQLTTFVQSAFVLHGWERSGIFMICANPMKFKSHTSGVTGAQPHSRLSLLLGYRSRADRLQHRPSGPESWKDLLPSSFLEFAKPGSKSQTCNFGWTLESGDLINMDSCVSGPEILIELLWCLIA